MHSNVTWNLKPRVNSAGLSFTTMLVTLTSAIVSARQRGEEAGQSGQSGSRRCGGNRGKRLAQSKAASVSQQCSV
jgi:hypothetical protein